MRRLLSCLLLLSAGLASAGCGDTPATNTTTEPTSRPGEKDKVKTKVKGGVSP